MKDTTYDFVIIGSGIGGLISGLVLSREGYSVLILEKNHQIGGGLQVFSRDKCVFDTGVHYVGGLDEGENLNRLFKFLGILEDLKMKRMDADCFDLIVFPDGKEYKHGQGYELFKQGLLESFPEEETAIDAFCTAVQETCQRFPLYNIQQSSDAAYYHQPEILDILAYDFIASLTDNFRLQQVLAGSVPLYAGKKNKTPFYVLALILNSFIKGSYRMIDGGSQIAILLSKQFRAYGGTILKHKEVVSASFNENGTADYVSCSDGSEYKGTNFISNLHPEVTIDLFGESHFLNAYKKRIRNLENTISSFTAHLVFHENSFPYLNYNIYQYSIDNVWDSIDCIPEKWPEVLYICTPSSSKNPEFAEALSVMAYMDYSEMAPWIETFNTAANKNERGQAYDVFKQEKEEQIIKRLEERYPDIRRHIKSIYSSTPLTYKDYLGTKDGGLYGILKDATNSAASSINPKTRIPNVYLTGQNLIFHGVLGATIGALVTSFLFLDSEKMIKKIVNCEK